MVERFSSTLLEVLVGLLQLPARHPAEVLDVCVTHPLQELRRPLASETAQTIEEETAILRSRVPSISNEGRELLSEPGLSVKSPYG